MDALPPESASRRSASLHPLSSTVAVMLAILFGLCGGYLDLLLMWVQSHWWTDDVPKRIGRDFPWTVPVGHALLLLIPGVMIAAVSRLRPRLFSLRAGSWLFATLAIWAALLRLPLYGACTLLLAVGLGRPISAAVANRGRSSRTVRSALVGSSALLAVLAALSSGRAGDPGTRRRGRIAATTAGCPQRRPDRLGHRPRLQPEPVRLSAEDHSQSGAVGAGGRPV